MYCTPTVGGPGTLAAGSGGDPGWMAGARQRGHRSYGLAGESEGGRTTALTPETILPRPRCDRDGQRNACGAGLGMVRRLVSAQLDEVRLAGWVLTAVPRIVRRPVIVGEPVIVMA